MACLWYLIRDGVEGVRGLRSNAETSVAGVGCSSGMWRACGTLGASEFLPCEVMRRHQCTLQCAIDSLSHSIGSWVVGMDAGTLNGDNGRESGYLAACTQGRWIHKVVVVVVADLPKDK